MRVRAATPTRSQVKEVLTSRLGAPEVRENLRPTARERAGELANVSGAAEITGGGNENQLPFPKGGGK